MKETKIEEVIKTSCKLRELTDHTLIRIAS
jgi:hypothetical protein